MTQSAIGRIDIETVRRYGGRLMVNGFMANDASRVRRRKVATYAMTIERCSESRPVRDWFHVPMALQTGLFFMADGAGLTIPRRLNAMGTPLPGRRMVCGRCFRVALVAELLLWTMAQGAVGRINLRFASVRRKPYIGCVVWNTDAATKLGNNIGARVRVTDGAFI